LPQATVLPHLIRSIDPCGSTSNPTQGSANVGEPLQAFSN
jgi:hypothetical protein